MRLGGVRGEKWERGKEEFGERTHSVGGTWFGFVGGLFCFVFFFLFRGFWWLVVKRFFVTTLKYSDGGGKNPAPYRHDT